MARQTPETMLISAIINTGNVRAGADYGITEEHFNGHRQVYEWVQQYARDYQTVPTPDHLQMAFPLFPYSPDEHDPRFPAAQVCEDHMLRLAKLTITEATQAINEDRAKDAYEVLGQLRYTGYADRPLAMLSDEGYFEDYETREEVTAPTPWQSLNNWTGGVRAGELWFFGARPSQGKSWSLVSVAAEAAKQGQRVLYYSLEMHKRLLQVRLHAVMGQMIGWGDEIDALAMKDRSYDLRKYKQLVNDIKHHFGSGVVDIYDTSQGRVSPLIIDAHASEYDMILVDYMGLMRTETGHRSVEDWRAAAANSNSLKEIALAHDVRMVAATQLNRDARSTPSYWKAPSMDNVSQSDALSQDADVLVTMQRMGRSAMTYSLEKNRNGEAGRHWYSNFDAQHGDFTEISRERAEHLRDMDDAEDS